MQLKTYAAIENNKVINFIVAHENSEHPYDKIVCIENFDNGEYPIMLGSSYQNDKFIPSEENLKELELIKESQKEALSNAIRSERNQKLVESDIVMFKFLENGNVVPESLQKYRQALRDIPEQIGFPENIVWPEKPE